MSDEKGYFAHPSAFVDEGAQIGEGTKIWHFAHIMGGAKIGRGCNFGQNVMVGGGVVTQEWADEIGADGYGDLASDAVEVAKELTTRKKGA